MRQVEIVAAIDRADRDQADRRIVLLHVPDLHRRGVRAQQGQAAAARACRRRTRPPRCAVGGRQRGAARKIQRVLHVARRMLRRHVERFEVVVVVLDFGPFEHLVAEACEDALHLHRGRG